MSVESEIDVMKTSNIHEIRKRIRLLEKQSHHKYMMATYIRYSLITFGILLGFCIGSLSIYYFVLTHLKLGVSLLIISLAITAVLILIGNLIFTHLRKVNTAIASDMMMEIKHLQELEKIYNNRY